MKSSSIKEFFPNVKMSSPAVRRPKERRFSYDKKVANIELIDGELSSDPRQIERVTERFIRKMEPSLLVGRKRRNSMSRGRASPRKSTAAGPSLECRLVVLAVDAAIARVNDIKAESELLHPNSHGANLLTTWTRISTTNEALSTVLVMAPVTTVLGVLAALAVRMGPLLPGSVATDLLRVLAGGGLIHQDVLNTDRLALMQALLLPIVPEHRLCLRKLLSLAHELELQAGINNFVVSEWLRPWLLVADSPHYVLSRLLTLLRDDIFAVHPALYEQFEHKSNRAGSIFSRRRRRSGSVAPANEHVTLCCITPIKSPTGPREPPTSSVQIFSSTPKKKAPRINLFGFNPFGPEDSVNLHTPQSKRKSLSKKIKNLFF